MFEREKLIEVERRVVALIDERAKAGLPQIDTHILRALARQDIEKELEAARPAPRVVLTPLPPVAPTAAKPLPASKPAPRKPVVPPPSAAVLAERARAQAISSLAPPGAEAEVAEAIRTGASVDEFKGMLAARAILEAGRLARGR